jgi:hypothetical protein
VQPIHLPYVCRKPIRKDTPERFLTTLTCDRRRPIGLQELRAEAMRAEKHDCGGSLRHRNGGDPGWLRCGDCDGPILEVVI